MKRRVSAILLFLLLLGAAFALLRSGHTYFEQDREALMEGSSSAHWFGTDQLGRDRAVRTAVAMLLALAGATAASAVTTSIAAAAGSLAAFSPKLLASGIILGCDLFLALPWLFLLMMVRSGLPLTTSPLQSATVTFLVLAFLGWSACARAVYRGVMDLRASEWMIQGRAGGLRPVQLLRVHVLPHLRPLLLPQFLLCIPGFIVAEANLGTLGLGIAEPLPSWGTMLLELDNSALLARSAWVYLPIGLLVTVLLLLESFVPEV